MNPLRFVLAVSLSLSAAFAQEATTGAIAPKALVDFSDANVVDRFIPEEKAKDVVALSKDEKGVGVTIQPSELSYPGMSVKPPEGTWDLSPWGHVEVTLTNTSDKVIAVGLRVDASSWKENSAELIRLKPGQTTTGKVYFGYSFGKKSDPIDITKLTQLLIFSPKLKDTPISFRIESIQAAGPAGETPPIDPNTVRVDPKDGILLGAGSGIKLEQGKNVATKGGAQATLGDGKDGQALKVTFTGGAGQTAGLKPAEGRWGLTGGLELTAKVRNDGKSPITPGLRVESNGGPIEIKAATPLAPGAETELVVPYRNSVTWKNTPGGTKQDPATGNKFTSNRVSAINFTSEGAGEITVTSLKATMPPDTTPEWLGKRPPVEGDWELTFEEDFTAKDFDTAKWNLVGPNYYDQRSHFTAKNNLLENGNAILRYEKKTGFQEDDPSKKQTDYAVGYLNTFNKFAQRYGYFESRMRVPRIHGLWPAFWLMPDRGPNSGPGRDSTKNGGMEFDIMESNTGWGPNRYNIAMHWDGYGKEHQATGSDRVYVEPDKDGWVTTGLLVTPGSAVFYCNGKEVLRCEDPRIADVPLYILFTMPAGGWDNEALEDKDLPSDFVIDYVRVWQRKDLK